MKEILGRQLDLDIDALHDYLVLVDDLGADDLALVEIVIEFEKQFEFYIPDAEIFVHGECSNDTVASVVEYMLSRVEFEP